MDCGEMESYEVHLQGEDPRNLSLPRRSRGEITHTSVRDPRSAPQTLDIHGGRKTTDTVRQGEEKMENKMFS